MQKWEYKFVYLVREDKANELGRDGWELVAVTPDNEAIFKRPIK
jgi:hypothetical protein